MEIYYLELKSDSFPPYGKTSLTLQSISSPSLPSFQSGSSRPPVHASFLLFLVLTCVSVVRGQFYICNKYSRPTESMTAIYFTADLRWTRPTFHCASCNEQLVYYAPPSRGPKGRVVAPIGVTRGGVHLYFGTFSL